MIFYNLLMKKSMQVYHFLGFLVVNLIENPYMYRNLGWSYLMSIRIWEVKYWFNDITAPFLLPPR